MIRPSPRASIVLLFVCAACAQSSTQQPANGLTPQEHAQWFPIDSAAVHALEKQTPDGVIACESCHTSDAVEQISCIGCHKHPTAAVNGRDVNDTLHLDAPDYRTRVPVAADVPTKSAGCYTCHKEGKRLLEHFPHGGIEPGQGSFCIMCHDNGTAFDAFAVKAKEDPNFKHLQTGGADCGGCHKTETWKGAVGVPLTVFDPARSVQVDALSPRYVATSIATVSANVQTINMTMNHGATAVGAGVLTTCSNCHAAANSGVYFPGLMHSSLANLGLTQPATCNECHGLSIPVGFVGDLDSRRSPRSGEMKHDAVAWTDTAPTSTKLVTADCGVCHQAPNENVDAKWKFAYGKPDAGAAFHGPLMTAGAAQPTSCIDCHANSRPVGPVGAIAFNHDPSALGNCATCHGAFTTWAGGKYHQVGSSTPASCVPCHEAARPTSTSGWMQPNYAQRPFDYVTNANGDKHGAGQDCVKCHNSAGSGLWGVNHNWQRGAFDHDAGADLTSTTCLACHTTQRPDKLAPPVLPAQLPNSFDHSASGTGDCLGCHTATVARASYDGLYPIPDGGWRGGAEYPGTALITAPNQFVRIPSTALTRTGALVTSMATTTVTLPNAMLHTATVIPPALNAGPAGDSTKCHFCHNSTNYSNGAFHAALTDAGFPQPNSGCNECHRTMRPPNIVTKLDAGTWVVPMDHSALFTGGAVAGVKDMDCSVCHKTPGLPPTRWSDGKFHPNVPNGAQPAECVSCHYPLMTTAAADVTSPSTPPSDYSMKHRSTLITSQACAACHSQALTKSTTTPTTTGLWKTGAYHPSLTATTQPATCLDCHSTSEPTVAKQGTVVYTFAMGGGSSTNAGQWMSHTDSTVTGKDCVTCHQADAKVSGAAWNKAAPYHANVPSVATCATCHGTTNGGGTANNNLPVGLTTSSTVTTSTVSPGLNDQIAHTDVNVTAYDCAVCHTQKGPSTVTGVQGKEWKQAKFHANFGATRALLMNQTTGRCSSCHMNVKPPGLAGTQDHAAFTNVSGSQDCSSCHSFPGTGTTTSPNWKGAAGYPTYISVGGFLIPAPPAGSTGTTQSGISNLPHPTVGAGVQCTACHPASNPNHKNAGGYDHASALAATKCSACHEAGSNLVNTVWSATTRGDTRMLTSVSMKKDQTTYTCSPKHFFPVDCQECHTMPSGNGTWTSATNAGNAWMAPHVHGGNNRGPMNSPATCNLCHQACGIPK